MPKNAKTTAQNTPTSANACHCPLCAGHSTGTDSTQVGAPNPTGELRCIAQHSDCTQNHPNPIPNQSESRNQTTLRTPPSPETGQQSALKFAVQSKNWSDPRPCRSQPIRVPESAAQMTIQGKPRIQDTIKPQKTSGELRAES